MGTERETVETTKIRKQARPWSGFFLGLLLGLAVAVIVQQAGMWPLDRLLLFGAAGLFALIGTLLGGAGRERVGTFSTVATLILAIALIGFGATGIGSIDENGVLNGGCTVEAGSDVDTTIVTDTSRQNPFEVDPEGGLSWLARSPGPITNHLWDVYVDVGGFPVAVAANEEVEPNSDMDTENVGEVGDVSGYVREVTNLVGVELAGVFEVGGQIEGDGGACDGFAFVTVTAAPLSTLVSQIAAGIGVLALIGLLVIAFNRTREVVVVDEARDEGLVEGTGAAGAAGVPGEGPTPARGSGAHLRPDEPDDLEEIPPEPDDRPGP